MLDQGIFDLPWLPEDEGKPRDKSSRASPEPELRQKKENSSEWRGDIWCYQLKHF